MLLSSGTTIGRTPGRPLPGLLLRCHFPQVRPSVVPPTDRCPGYRSDAAFRRYDHRSYPRQTAARAAAQMPLSSGTTIGRTPGRPLPGLLLRCRFPQVRPSVVPPNRSLPGSLLRCRFPQVRSSVVPPSKPLPGLPLRYCFPQVRPSVVPPGRSLPGLLLRCCFPQVRPSVVPPADRCPGCSSATAFLRYDHRSYPRQTAAQATAQMLLSSQC